MCGYLKYLSAGKLSRNLLRHMPRHNVTGSGSTQSKRELYNLLRRRTRQGLDDAPFGDGFDVGKVPLPLCFLFDQAVCALRVRQGVRRCHLQWARRVHAEGDRGDEGGRDADADAGRGEARASAVGTGARGSTICNGHTRSGGRLLPFMRRLPVRVAQLSSPLL